MLILSVLCVDLWYISTFSICNRLFVIACWSCPVVVRFLIIWYPFLQAAYQKIHRLYYYNVHFDFFIVWKVIISTNSFEQCNYCTCFWKNSILISIKGWPYGLTMISFEWSVSFIYIRFMLSSKTGTSKVFISSLICSANPSRVLIYVRIGFLSFRSNPNTSVILANIQ